jgi:hypothetical protein
MNFGMGLMPFKATQNSYFLFVTVGNSNIADAKTCEVGQCKIRFDVITCDPPQYHYR